MYLGPVGDLSVHGICGSLGNSYLQGEVYGTSGIRSVDGRSSSS